MASVNILAAGRVQSYIRKTIQQKLLSSPWDQISNVFSSDQPVPRGDSAKIPSAVVHKITDEFRRGQYQTTLISVRKPNMAVIGGANSAEGKEGKPSTKIVSVFYAPQRFAQVLGDNTVMGNMEEFYGLAEKTIQIIGDLFAQQTSYDHEHAMINGADPVLQDVGAWQSSEYGSEINAPQALTLHPNTYAWINGALVVNTWSSTYATAVSNLETATDTEMDSGDGMTIPCLNAIALKAQRTIVPLGGMGGNAEVKWVLKISDAQAQDLGNDTTASSSFQDMLKYTEKGFDRLFVGYIGVYRGMMIIVDESAPLADNTSGTLTFQFNTPNGDNRIRQAKASSDGTMECAMLMGNGAIGLVDKMEMDLVRKSRDYEFIKSVCGERHRGTQRMDLDATVVATSARVNETSFIVWTATLAAAV